MPAPNTGASGSSTGVSITGATGSPDASVNPGRLARSRTPLPCCNRNNTASPSICSNRRPRSRPSAWRMRNGSHEARAQPHHVRKPRPKAPAPGPSRTPRRPTAHAVDWNRTRSSWCNPLLPSERCVGHAGHRIAARAHHDPQIRHAAIGEPGMAVDTIRATCTRVQCSATRQPRWRLSRRQDPNDAAVRSRPGRSCPTQ